MQLTEVHQVIGVDVNPRVRRWVERHQFHQLLLLPLLHTYAHTRVCMCALMYACMYVCMYACMYACMYMRQVLSQPRV